MRDRDESNSKKSYAKPSLRILNPESICPSERLAFCHIKYLYINDTFARFRDKFVDQAFPDCEINRYRILFDDLPRTYERADIVVVGGNDPDRLAAFIKVNEPLLRNVPKLALSQNIAPRRRADLLNVGYDDVLNMRSCGAEEFGARALSIFERYRLASARHEIDLFAGAGINKVCDYEKLTFSQRRIVKALISAPGRYCSYDKLARLASRDHIDLTPNHLRVLIHQIRPKLSPDYEIAAVYGEGYRLLGPSMYD